MNLNSTMLEALRGRRGLNSDDTSQDAEIERMLPVDVVKECVKWELGYAEWAGLIADWMMRAGAKQEDF